VKADLRARGRRGALVLGLTGPLLLGLTGSLALGACGGKAQDTTTFTEPPSTEPVSFDPAGSRALEALSEPAARDAFCGWIGASAANLADRAGTALDCSSLVQRCRDAASDPSLAGPLDVQAGLLGVPDDLEGALGCPASVTEIDACLGELIQVVVARYPDGPGCGTAAMVAPLGLQDLVGLSSCLQVAADCPELLQQLLASAR
jgi:hypothetical protein